MSRLQTYVPPPGSLQFKRLFPGFSKSGARIVFDDASAVRDRYEEVEKWLQTLSPEDQDRGRSLVQNLCTAISELQDDLGAQKQKDDEYEDLRARESKRPGPDEPRLESRMNQDARMKAKRDFDAMFPTASRLIRS